MFIKLTSIEVLDHNGDETPIFIKKEDIEAVFTDEYGNTEIDTRDNIYNCQESVEDVICKIECE